MSQFFKTSLWGVGATFAKDARGNAAAMFGLALVPLALVTGVSIDYSRVSASRVNLQAAVDAATLAAAGASSDQAAIGGAMLASSLGAASAMLASSNFVTNADGTVTGSATIDVPMSFMRIAGFSTMATSVTATAGRLPSSGNSAQKVCILLKDPKASQALLINSGVKIDAPNCEIDVVSTGNTAAMIDNGGKTNVASLCVASGSVTVNGSAPPTLKTGCKVAADPLSGNLPMVTSTACTVSNQNYSGYNSLAPGVYCGNFNFNGSGTLNLSPGLYVLKGARWNLNSGWTINGTGVTFYFADSGSYIQVNSGVAINVSAPTSGAFAGLLMFEPTGLSTSSFTINGSAGHSFSGLIYLPSRNVTFNSVSSVTSENITMVFNQMILDEIDWKFTSSTRQIQPANATTTQGGVVLMR